MVFLIVESSGRGDWNCFMLTKDTT